VRAADEVARLLLGPVTGRLPGNVVRSVAASSQRPEINRHVEAVRALHPATVVRYDFPTQFGPQFARDKAFDTRHIFTLRDVVADPSTGLVWTPEGEVLQESVGSLYRLLTWGGVRHSPLISATELVSDKPVVLCPYAGAGYYHWLLEVLPTVLAALQVEPTAVLIIPPSIPPYMTAVLDDLRQRGVRTLDTSAPVRIRRLIMPAAGAYSGFVHPGELDVLRVYGGTLRVGEEFRSGTPPMIYISRRGTRRRALEGEAELEQELSVMGLQIVRLEDLEWRDQVGLFRHAALVVGPHGAGLSNLVWCVDEPTVVEVFAQDFFNDCYARMAVMLGCRYSYMESQPSPGDGMGRMPIPSIVSAVSRALKGDHSA
jgi:capsular polysaccharide biosynthesis protein